MIFWLCSQTFDPDAENVFCVSLILIVYILIAMLSYCNYYILNDAISSYRTFLWLSSEEIEKC